VFPGLQGGPHNHTIGGISTALHDVISPEHKEYSKQIKANAKTLANSLMEKGHKLVTDGTDNHIVLWNVRAQNLTGSKVESACNHTNVTLNKNTIAGDVSAANPGGIRLGTPACTTRGYKESDMKIVAEFLDRIIKSSIRIQETSGKKLVDFQNALPTDPEINKISKEVEQFAIQFSTPGI